MNGIEEFQSFQPFKMFKSFFPMSCPLTPELFTLAP
jgi:hypothetical protein